MGPELGPEAFCLWLLCVFIASIACHIGGLCMMSTLDWLEWCPKKETVICNSSVAHPQLPMSDILSDLTGLGSRSNNERQQGFKGGTGGQSPSWRTMIRTGYGPVGLRHPRVAETIKPAGSNEKKEAGTARGLANPASRSLFFKTNALFITFPMPVDPPWFESLQPGSSDSQVWLHSFQPSEVKIFRKWLEKNRKEIKAEQYRSIVKQTMLLAAAQMEAARGLPHGGVSSCGDGHGLC